MIKVAIVEDHDKEAEDLIRNLRAYEDLHQETFEIECFSNALSFLDRYEPQYEIIFMDIDMPYMNGVDAAKKLRKIDENVVLIFVTALAQFAVQGYDVGALDFIVKPVRFKVFEDKMDRAVLVLKKRTEKQIVIKNEDGIKVIDDRDLLYIEVINRILHFHLGSSGQVYTMRGTLASVKKQLGDQYFEECSNGILVNLSKVSMVEGYTVELINGEHMTVSRSRKPGFLRRLAEYHGNWKINMGRLQ